MVRGFHRINCIEKGCGVPQPFFLIFDPFSRLNAFGIGVFSSAHFGGIVRPFQPCFGWVSTRDHYFRPLGQLLQLLGHPLLRTTDRLPPLHTARPAPTAFLPWSAYNCTGAYFLLLLPHSFVLLRSYPIKTAVSPAQAARSHWAVLSRPPVPRSPPPSKTGR